MPIVPLCFILFFLLLMTVFLLLFYYNDRLKIQLILSIILTVIAACLLTWIIYASLGDWEIESAEYVEIKNIVWSDGTKVQMFNDKESVVNLTAVSGLIFDSEEHNVKITTWKTNYYGIKFIPPSKYSLENKKDKSTILLRK